MVKQKGEKTLKKNKICLVILIVFYFVPSVLAADDVLSSIKEGKISGYLRNYFFSRDFKNGTTDRQDWAIGGKLHYETAPFKGVNMGFSFYTAQDFGLNDDDKDVYGLLADSGRGGREGVSVLGEAYIQAQWKDTIFKFGRQEIDNPWLNAVDIRFTPNTFQGFLVENKSFSGFTFNAGHITDVKARTESKFISLSKVLGAAESKPMTFAGIILDTDKNFKLQLWNYHAHDVWNDIYLRADYNHKLTKDITFLMSGGGLYRTDTGDELIGSIDSYMYTLKMGLNLYGFTLTSAYTQIGDQTLDLTLGYELLVSAQVEEAEQADEQAWMWRLSYDFSEIGINDLSAAITYYTFDRPNSGSNAGSDTQEIDFDVKYKFSGKLDGWSIRARYAILDREGVSSSEDLNDLRIYLSYTF